MNAKFISREGNTVKLEMTFGWDEFEVCIQDTYMKTRGQYALDGFRKGKAPRKLLESKFGEGIFYDDAITDLINKNYFMAVSQLGINPVDRPTVDFDDFKKGEDLVINVDVTVVPEFEIGKYKGLEVAKIEHTITDEDVNKEVEEVQKRSGRVVVVEREAKEGDTLLMDYAGFCGEDQFEGGTAQDQYLTLGSKQFIPGFEDQLIGKKAGDEVDVKVTFPEVYHSEDLAGKDAIFKVTVKEVKETELPEIDDEFVKDVSEFDTLDEYKADIKEKLEKVAAEKVEYETKNALLEKIYNDTEIDIPDAMVDSQIDEMIEEFNMQLMQQGMAIEQYFQYLGKTMDEFRSDIRPDALRKVKTRMIVDKIADVEAVEATDADIDDELAKIAEYYKIDVEKVREQFLQGHRELIVQDIRNRKAIEIIVENAVIA